MELQNEAHFILPFKLHLDYPQPLKLKQVIILSDNNLGFLFERQYIYYDILKNIIVNNKQLQYILEHPKRIGKSIVALTNDKKMLVMMNEKTGDIIKEISLQVQDKQFGGEFETIVFKQTQLMVLIFKESFMLSKKVMVFNNKLECISTNVLEMSFLNQFDDKYTLINFHQLTKNEIPISFVNITNFSIHITTIVHNISQLHKQILVLVKKLSKNELLLGFNSDEGGSLYKLSMERNTLWLLHKGISIAQFIKSIEQNHFIYFGYQRTNSPIGQIIHLQSFNSTSLPLQLKPSNFDYQNSKYVVNYSHQLKPNLSTQLQIIKPMKKRSLVANLLFKSQHFKTYGSGLGRCLFKIYSFERQNKGKNENPEISVNIINRIIEGQTQ